MPTEDQRPTNAPDTREQYERAVPEKEPGLGRMDDTDNTPHEQPDLHEDSRDNDPSSGMEIHAQETQDLSDSVDPSDPRAHGNRQGAGEAEATGKDKHQQASDRERR